jgi:hypothetical protein
VYPRSCARRRRPKERKIHLTDKPNHAKQPLNTNKTRKSAKHAKQVTTAPDVNATDSPEPLPPARTRPTPIAQAPTSTTNLANLERATTALAEHIRAVVDKFPPLTPEQRDRIATLLRTTGNQRNDMTNL